MKKEEKLLQEIGNIQDFYVLDAAEAHPAAQKKHWHYRSILGIAACAILCIGVGSAYWLSRSTPSISTESSSDDSNLQIPNPFQDCASMAEAAALTGFSIEVPDTFQSNTTRKISVMDGEMIQVSYLDSDENELLYIRKEKGSDDISGDYNQYDTISACSINGAEVTMRSNNGIFYAAIWTKDGYSYCVGALHNGFSSQEELEDLISQIQ